MFSILQPAWRTRSTAAAQQRATVRIAMALVAVRKHRADVAEPGRAEDRVGDCVQQHVGVGVTEQAALERNLDAADHQPATRHQRMDVEPLPDAKGRSS